MLNGISEGIDVKKTSASKECIICHFYIGVLSFIEMPAMGVMMY